MALHDMSHTIETFIANFCFSSNSARRFLRKRATIKTIAVVVAIAMIRTTMTVTTPPMMATVLSALDCNMGIVATVVTLSTSDAAEVYGSVGIVSGVDSPSSLDAGAV